MNPNDRTNQKKETSDKIKAARQDFLTSLRRTFDSPDGRKVLAWLHSTTGSGKPAFQPDHSGSFCPHAAAFRDGRKSIHDEISANLAEAGANPEAASTTQKPKAVS